MNFTHAQRVKVLRAGLAGGALVGVLLLVFGCQSLGPRAVPFRGDRVDEWGNPTPAPAYTNAPWTDFTNRPPVSAGSQKKAVRLHEPARKCAHFIGVAFRGPDGGRMIHAPVRGEDPDLAPDELMDRFECCPVCGVRLMKLPK